MRSVLTIPSWFNIGVACTDAHDGSQVAGRVAMIVEDEAHGTASITYAGLAAATSIFAGFLQEIGLAAGERVLIRLPNSLAYPVVFLGTLKCGAIAVPVSTLLTAEEVAYLARDAGATVVVTDRTAWPALRARLESVASLRHVVLAGSGDVPAAGQLALHDLQTILEAAQTHAEPYPTRAEDPAYLVYTSGTSGYPKGVLHAHRALLGHAPAWAHWFDFREHDRILHSGKFNWTYVLGTGLMDPLYLGHTVIVYEGTASAAQWTRLIARHQATIFIGVPTVYRQILQKTSASAADVPTLRHCMCAGEHLSDDVLYGWRQRFGRDIYEAIGMSECSYYLSQTPHRPIRPGTVGFPQPGHTVALLDAELQPVPTHVEGMICIRDDDPGLFLRYWNLPNETAQVRRDGWFLTGDYARRDVDGYIWFLGRKDDIIKSFGYRVSPFEIERVLKDLPGVADCAVIGEEVEPGKTLIAAYIVRLPDVPLTADTVTAYATEHLARYKCPHRVTFVDSLPRTPNGKVLRRELRSREYGVGSTE